MNNREEVLIFKNIALYLMTTRFSVAVTQNLNGMAGFFQRHFSGTDNLRVVSIILLLLAFVLFLFLVIILYIKSLLSFIKNDVSVSVQGTRKADTSMLSRDLEFEKTKEKELELELERSKNLQQANQNKIKREEERKMRENNARKLEEKKKLKTNTVYQKSDILENSRQIGSEQQKAYFGVRRDFDWKTGKVVELDEATAGISSFRYEQTYRTLDSMTGLILNMFARNIDSGKIAQTIKVRCGDNASEEDIIQLIDSMKNFISLCNNGKFANLPGAEYLPTPDEALYNLAQGDSTYCLSMLEALMNSTVDKGHSVKVVQKRDIAFMEASNYACTFGTLASLTDRQLALSSFELAIELSPKNVNAWSRVADMYNASSLDSKAIWAYQNVVNMGDEDIYPHQVANANMQMSKYYSAQGDNAKASTLYSYGHNYYSSIGINRDLTIKEHDIIGIIESKQKDDLPDTISKLLHVSRQRHSAYR